MINVKSMKENKGRRTIIVLGLFFILGFVYYLFFYTPNLGHYVYLERRNMHTLVAHSKENCSCISGGLRRMKTKDYLAKINSVHGWTYCNKCLTCDMLVDYSKKYNAPISMGNNTFNMIPANQIASSSSVDYDENIIDSTTGMEEYYEEDEFEELNYDNKEQEYDEEEVEETDYLNDL